MREFGTQDDIMTIGGLKATEIADRFGTPVYVTDEQALRANYRRIYSAFAQHMDTRVHYACKANTNLAILRVLEQEGSFIDAVSIGEVETCLRAGFTADRILYTGVNVSNAELEAVLSHGVMVNIDSLSELERMARMVDDAPVSFRVTPGVGSGHHEKVVTGARGSKFGVPIEQVQDAYGRAVELGLRPVGMHAHIGSGGRSPDPFIDLVGILLDEVAKLEGRGISLDFLDLGGGIGIPYRPQDGEMDVEELAHEITELIKLESSIPTIALEPGRFIVADTTVLLTRVNDVKRTPEKNFIGVDAGFNTLIRPAFYDSYHHVAVANRFGKAGVEKYDVVGPICESGDYLARDRPLPPAEEGDLVAIYDAGAYGSVMSSNYNSRPRCAEVLVNEGEADLIRERETLEDILRHQLVPERLIG